MWGGCIFESNNSNIHPLLCLGRFIAHGCTFGKIWYYHIHALLTSLYGGTKITPRSYSAFTVGILLGVDWKILTSGRVTESFQYHLCSTYRGLWGLVVVRLLWLMAEYWLHKAGSISSDCQPFHFLLFYIITWSKKHNDASYWLVAENWWFLQSTWAH